MFTDFTLRQGEKIVSSLEHLLFKFLNQIPNGIEKYNDKKENAKFKVSTKGDAILYEDDIYTDNEELVQTGMIEKVERKFCRGMDNVLGLGEGDKKNLRFLNLLAIVRHEPKLQDGKFIDNPDQILKRCQGAIDTVKFGTTLIQVPDGCPRPTMRPPIISSETGNVKIDDKLITALGNAITEAEKKVDTITISINEIPDASSKVKLTSALKIKQTEIEELYEKYETATTSKGGYRSKKKSGGYTFRNKTNKRNKKALF